MGGTYFNRDGSLKDFPWIKADELGPCREHLHFYKPYGAKTARCFPGKPQDKTTEIFVDVELKDRTTRKSGWLTRNKTTDRFTSTLFQEMAFNQHIHFIEWDEPDLINCVVCDGIYISEAHFFMTKKEFEKFVSRWTPPVFNDGRVYTPLEET